MCLMQISDILYEVMLFFGQNMSHCVMSQTVLNGITVTGHDKPMRHTKRNEVFLRLFCNHWSRKYPVLILHFKQISVILAAFLPIKLNLLSLYRIILHVYAGIGIETHSYVYKFWSV